MIKIAAKGWAANWLQKLRKRECVHESEIAGRTDNESVGETWIGTSGWHYKHWLGNFYPSSLPLSQMLAHYMQRFDSVELNNSFYKLPAQTSLLNWRETTPPHFRFAIKASRFLTHMKKLKNAEDGLKRFLDAVLVLQPKMGPILFQLPPGWELNLDRLAAFLPLLPRYLRCAFEFRNTSWDRPETYKLLSEFNAGYCIFDLAGYHAPKQVTADFAYVRLHGPGNKYQGSYSDLALADWAEEIRAWNQKLTAVYVYFDNDDSGFAPRDALRLKALVAAR